MRHLVLIAALAMAGCTEMPAWLAPVDGAPPPPAITVDEAMMYARALGLDLGGAERFDMLSEDQKAALCFFAVYRLQTRFNAASEALCAPYLPSQE